MTTMRIHVLSLLKGHVSNDLRQIEQPEPVIQALESLPPNRVEEILAAYKHYDLPYYQAIIGALLTSEDPFVGGAVAHYLRTEGPWVVPYLLDVLDKVHAVVQMQMLMSLEQVADIHCVPQLLAILKTSDEPTVRYTLIQILGQLGDPMAIDTIKAYADDPNHHVRERVILALERLGAS